MNVQLITGVAQKYLLSSEEVCLQIKLFFEKFP